MRRARAVAYLLRCRADLVEKMVATRCGSIELESRQLDLIDGTILDVRAGRLHIVELTCPERVTVHIMPG